MTQHNLIETIEKALELRNKRGWEHGVCEEWLRALLEENKRLQSERDLAVRDGLMQSIDHLEHVETELEIIVKLKNLIQSLCTELSAKDKVLEWYANEENYDVNVTNQWEPVLPISSDNGGQARTILSQYRRTTDETN